MLLALALLVQVSLTAHGQMSTQIVVRQRPVAPPHSPSANLGSLRAWPGSAAKAIMRKFDDQGKIFEVASEHDQFGFRLTGRAPSKTKPEFHLFLNGCSWTYGVGVAGDKTFAAHLEAQRPRYRVVNMGARGGSPAEALYIWRNFNWQEIYPEKKGLLIYTLIRDHYERLVRTWRYLDWAPPMSPVFDDGLKESRQSAELLDYKWAKFIEGLGLEYWWLRGTAHFRPKDLPDFNDLIVRYMAAIKVDYLKRYPAGRFVITWMRHEALNYSEERLQTLTAALDKAGIEYWHPTEPLRQRREDYGIPRDGHPTELAHSEFAEFLLNHL
jgi:hypothetical protein